MQYLSILQTRGFAAQHHDYSTYVTIERLVEVHDPWGHRCSPFSMGRSFDHWTLYSIFDMVTQSLIRRLPVCNQGSKGRVQIDKILLSSHMHSSSSLNCFASYGIGPCCVEGRHESILSAVCPRAPRNSGHGLKPDAKID